MPISTKAAVFGDANSQNGIEDQRLARGDADKWPIEFKSVGRIYCEGAVQGSAVLFKQESVKVALSPEPSHKASRISPNALPNLLPRLLTAKHVIENFDISSCAFVPEWDTWRHVGMISVSVKGESTNSPLIAAKYSRDWVVIELLPWQGWQQYALSTEALSHRTGDFHSDNVQQAHMVGFDLLSNKMVAHLNCQFGLSAQSNLLSDYPKLYWDDCDSTQGASGGALFAEAEGSYKLLGLRVGSLFDESIVGQYPEIGSRFDIDANINVTRAISSEMFEPVCTFTEMGCEPVGNNDSWVEN